MRKKRFLAACLAASMVFNLTLNDMTVLAARENVTPGEYIISKNCPVYASSAKQDGSYAVDGDETTRWESDFTDNEWIYVDLGKECQITGLRLLWEGAYAKEYSIEVSNDEMNWKLLQDVKDSNGGEDTFDLEAEARYVRISCHKRAMEQYGNSLFELQVFGLDGMVQPDPDYGTNLALNKTIEASSIDDAWWVKSDQDVWADNAVDGNASTSWHSRHENNQWVVLDLEQSYNIGRVLIDWGGDMAQSFDVQVSDNKKDWTTVYRELNNHPGDANIGGLDVNGRYVKLNLYGGYTGLWINGFSINELSVYERQAGDTKKTYPIQELTTATTIEVPGSDATYMEGELNYLRAKTPYYKEDDLTAPLASNDWWQSALINELGNMLVAVPLKAKNTKTGVGILTMTDGWLSTDDTYQQGDLFSTRAESQIDLYVGVEPMNTTQVYDKVAGYGDYHVTTNLYDAKGLSMTTTFVKGSPYIYTEVPQDRDMVINANYITKIVNDKGNDILQANGDIYTGDHIAIEITDADNKEKTKTSKNYYCINVPEGTTFKKVGNKLKLAINGEKYMSVATMPDLKAGTIDEYYQHGYAFVTGTKATYEFNEDTNVITTYYTVTTDLKREGFSDQTFQYLMPHQWKKSDEHKDDPVICTSARGDMKRHIGNIFSTKDYFYGIVPQFTTPQNDEYSNEAMLSYLAGLDKSTSGDYASLVGTDAYWQGKNLQPLAMGVIAADQIGQLEYRDEFLSRLRYILEDWMTYSGSGDNTAFYYDQNWGTLYYKDSEFGANAGISDHHFTYGYMIFSMTVLAAYDDDFYEKYKNMIDLIVRDYASPYDDDSMFCRFRSFDPYEGHSWAGGYADNDDGNNQEAAGESLFGWVGEYLWGVRSGNKDFRDAAIYGFTTEMNAIKNYWFNYDGDNWVDGYPTTITGQVYGANYFYGTFFDGNPTSVFGIHWCPVSEYLTYYGMEQDAIRNMYEGLLKDIKGQQEKREKSMAERGLQEGDKDAPAKVKTTASDWQHLFYPLLSQYDPDEALAELEILEKSEYTFSEIEGFNSYWFMQNMKDLGVRTDEIYAAGGVSATVYKNRDGKTYQAIVWNPSKKPLEVTFKNKANEIVGSATVAGGALVRLDPMVSGQAQAATATFSVDSGVYDTAQFVKISSKTDGAEIHYTTDGSVPTIDSPVYSERIPVTADTTIKALVTKAGYIDSAISSVNIKMVQNADTTGVNIAKGKTATASSENGTDVAGNAVDGDADTRWQAAQDDNGEYITVDLGEVHTINKVKLSWEPSYASQYEIQVSTDDKNYDTVVVKKNSIGKYETVPFDLVNARYVRIKCIERAMAYGVSLYEIGVYEANQVETPQFEQKSGTYDGNTVINIASATPGAVIRYTTDGSEPNENSTLYMPGFSIGENMTIKARAFKTGMTPSGVATETYEINNGTPVDYTEDYYDENNEYYVKSEQQTVEEEELAGQTGGVTTDSSPTAYLTDPDVNLAYKANVVVSSTAEHEAKNITDGNINTPFATNFDEMDGWVYIDFGEEKTFDIVDIYWAAATTNNTYKLQTSNDAKAWTDVYNHEKSDTAHDFIKLNQPVTARYVKMQGINCPQYGYNLREKFVWM